MPCDVEAAAAASAPVVQEGNPLGRKALGKAAVAWMSEGAALAASDFVKAHEDQVFAALVPVPQDMAGAVQWVDNYLSRVEVPAGELEHRSANIRPAASASTGSSGLYDRTQRIGAVLMQ